MRLTIRITAIMLALTMALSICFASVYAETPFVKFDKNVPLNLQNYENSLIEKASGRSLKKHVMALR